jgi:hypothetical protein
MEEIIQAEEVEDSTTSIVLRPFKGENWLLINYNDENLERVFNQL